MANKFKKTEYAIKSHNMAYIQSMNKYGEILNNNRLNISKIIEEVIDGWNFKLKGVNYEKLKKELKNNSNFNELCNILNNVKDKDARNEIDNINYEIFCKIIDKYINDILNLENPEKIDIVALLSLSEYIAERHLTPISSSKLRDFYDYIINIDENEKNWFVKFALLKSKIAYHVGKENNEDSKLALKKLGYIIDLVVRDIGKESDENKKEKYFKSFKTFLESIVAYHKIYAK